MSKKRRRPKGTKMYRKDNNGRVPLVFGTKELEEIFGGDVGAFQRNEKVVMMEALGLGHLAFLQPRKGKRKVRHVSDTEDYSEEHEYRMHLYESMN